MSEPKVLPAPAVEGNSTHGQLTEAAQGASLETVLLEGAPALVAPLREGAGGHCPEKTSVLQRSDFVDKGKLGRKRRYKMSDYPRLLPGCETSLNIN